jgi:hypothetical protein
MTDEIPQDSVVALWSTRLLTLAILGSLRSFLQMGDYFLSTSRNHFRIFFYYRNTNDNLEQVLTRWKWLQFDIIFATIFSAYRILDWKVFF